MTDENNNTKDESQSNNEFETKLAEVKDRYKNIEIKLTKILDNEKRRIPEEFHSLIPDHLPFAEQIDWIQSCKEKGFFKEKIESIDSKRPHEKKPTDLSNLTPHQMMSKGYQS